MYPNRIEFPPNTDSSLEKKIRMIFSLTSLRLASGITIEVEFSSNDEVEFKLDVFMMKVSRCLKNILVTKR